MKTNAKVSSRARRKAPRKALESSGPPERERRTSPDRNERAALTVLDEIEESAGFETRRLAERAVALGTAFFVRKMDHDLVNRVSGVESGLRQLGAELAKPAPDQALLSREVADTRVRIGRLYAFISRTRDLAMVTPPHYTEEALAPIVEAARAHVAEKLGPRAALLAFTAAVAEGLALHADYDALLQAIVDVVKDAAEAHDEGATRVDVSVAARTLRAGREIEIVVTDRGRGMDELSLEWAFVPFGTSKIDGAGIGMTLARKLVEDVHGGTMRIESKRGEGTRVRMVLPRKQEGVRGRRRLTMQEIEDGVRE